MGRGRNGVTLLLVRGGHDVVNCYDGSCAELIGMGIYRKSWCGIVGNLCCGRVETFVLD